MAAKYQQPRHFQPILSSWSPILTSSLNKSHKSQRAKGFKSMCQTQAQTREAGPYTLPLNRENLSIRSMKIGSLLGSIPFFVWPSVSNHYYIMHLCTPSLPGYQRKLKPSDGCPFLPRWPSLFASFATDTFSIFKYFSCLCVGMCVCLHACTYAHNCMVFLWRSETTLGAGPQVLYTFLLETGSLTDLALPCKSG